MIFDYLIPKLKNAFPNRILVVDVPNNKVIFPPVCPDFGNLEIQDDGDEITILGGKFTHGHFSNYDTSFTKEEISKKISEDVVKFLEEVFADKIIFWGSHAGGGGWRKRNASHKHTLWSRITGKDTTYYVWSGPLE